MGDWVIDLIAWLIVFPLLLFVALLVYRSIYRRYKKHERRRDHIEAVKQFEENERKIKESYKTDLRNK